MEKSNRKSKSTQESLAYIDDLTGLYNRRYLQVAQHKTEALRAKNIPYSLVTIDIDHFKEVNDLYGHAKGDEVIIEFAKFLRMTLRQTDIVLRHGGDEFICVMTNTDHKDARLVSTRIVERCRNHRFSDVEIMISVGIASCPNDSEDFEKLLKIADESLSYAKQSGQGIAGVRGMRQIELPTRVFVGRAEEKEALTRFLMQNFGTIRVILVEGNVGIGKTRFVKEVLSTLNSREILWSDCLAFFEDIPYYPIRELIKYKISRQGKAIVEDLPVAYRIEIGKLMPELIEEIEAKTDKIALVMDKYRLYESIRQIIELGITEKVIVIDNMQWSDRESMESIKYLLRSLREQPITFLFIYRKEEKSEVLEDFTSSISRETKVNVVNLTPLAHNRISEMIKLTIDEEPGRELLNYITKLSGGNPYYIEEILKVLHDDGYLTVLGDKWHFEKPDIEVIPRTIEDITERKYQALSNEGKEILEIASVIGEFDIEIIKWITGYNEGHIIGVIENIKKLGLIKEQGERIQFQEQASRGAIYKKNVAGMKARMLHKKVADKFAQRYKGSEYEIVENLAFHYYRGADQEKGVHYCLEAGDRAKEKYANLSAVKYYTWAEELLIREKEQPAIRKMADCLLKRANVLRFIGDNEGAIRDLDEALKKARRAADRKCEAEVRLNKALVLLKMAQYQAALSEVNQSIAIARRIGDKAGIARALDIVGDTFILLGKYEKALKFSGQSLKISRAIKDKWHEANVTNHIGIAYFDLGDYEQALKYYDYFLKISRRIGDKFFEGAAFNNMGTIFRQLAEYGKALKNYEAALKILRAIGNKYGEAITLNNIGRIHLHWGYYDKGLKYFEDALRITKDIDDRNNEALVLINIGNLYLNLGEYNKALKYLALSLDIGKRIKANNVAFYGSCLMGELYLTTEEAKKAKWFIDKAYKIAKASGSKKMLGDALFLLCSFFIEVRRVSAFKKNIKLLKNLTKEEKSKSIVADVEYLLGRHYIEINDFEKAHKNLSASLNKSSELRERLRMGIDYYYLGVLELKNGDKSNFQRNLGKAMTIFKTLDAKGWKEKTERTLRDYHKH